MGVSTGYARAIASTEPRTRAEGTSADPAEVVASVAFAKRSLLLHLNRHRLRPEELEDCYSQTLLELVAYVRAGGAFRDERHLAHALELRFGSRIRDRRRALAGRSPMQAALESAAPLTEGDDGISIIDTRADVERAVIVREEVRHVAGAARALTGDQRLVLAAQLGPREVSTAEFCAAHGWTTEKYRKVSQRARARLAKLTGRTKKRVPVTERESVEVPGNAYDNRSVDP
jgi:hypothetical protein